MKRYIYYIWCLLGLGLLTGCMFEEESIETEDDNLVHMVFTAMVEDGNPATRTVLDENEVDGFRGVLWEPEDVIGIATYNGRYQRFENVLEEPAASGVFEGSVNQDIMYYAIYPYRDNQQMGSSVNVAIPSKQTYQPDSFDGSAAPMVGKGNHAEPLHFMNLCGSLAINITGTEKIKSILFQTKAGEKVSGDATVDPDYADYPVMTMGEATDDYIVLDCGEGVQLSGTPTSFHFVLPPATYNGFDLLITTTDGQFMQKSTDKQLTIKRSIITKAASFAFENTADTFVNLSERGNANCYIVPQSGYYSFDGTVIGNGEFGFTPENNFHTNTHEISPVTAELLWADNHTLIKGCGYDASTGMVKFLTSGEEGNAVIAAKDSEGNILWSWHIWMTDQPEEQIYNNNAGIMMDRNLGAISATPGDVGALGLLYQWGRKDPFLGSASISSAVERESTITWPSPVSSDSSTGTIDYVISHPMTFVKSVSSSSYDWHYSSRDNTLWQSEKTIYDPCPSGWRVPDGGSNGVWATAMGSSSSYNRSYDSTNEGMNFSGDFGSASTIWYPASGTRANNNGELESVGGYGEYWSVVPSGYNAYYMYFASTGSVVPTDDGRRARGRSVRCTKDEGYVDISYPQVRMNTIEGITTSSAKLVALVKSEGVSSVTERGFIYGTQPDLSDGTKIQCGEGGGEFSYALTGLPNATKYYVKAYAVNSRGETQTEITLFMTHISDDIIDLSAKGTANSYIISNSGTFSINAVKGNSSESVGAIVSSDILWESYGTEEVPVVGALISPPTIKGERIVFDVPEPYREGNVVIAAKDAAGTILWSWHIWLTDAPEEQIYNNNAGIMMDRNLGATSATPGEVGALGLFYQWGRKDPFLGPSSISSDTEAKSTITWPSPQSSDSSKGTVDYVTSHPTTFVTVGSSSSDDWHYSSRDNTLWQSKKTIYDPCPVGWRVPDGDGDGVWETAGFSSTLYNSSNAGISFSISSMSTTWYPASGYRYYRDGALSGVNSRGHYWSVTTGSVAACYLYFSNAGNVGPTGNYCNRAYGQSVRCLQESE